MSSIGKRLGFSLCVGMLFLGALEIVGRLVGFRAETWSVLDSTLGWRMSEERSGLPLADGKAADFLLLGDSITYANHFRGSSFTDRLRQKGFTAINLSAIGYGTDQELLLLRRELPTLPTVHRVVLDFCLFNDFVNNAVRVNAHDDFRPKPFYELEGGRLVIHRDHLNFSFADHANLFLRQRSGSLYLAQRLSQKLHRKPPPAPTLKPVTDSKVYLLPPIDRPPTPQEVALYREKLEQAKDLTRALLLELKQHVGVELKADFLILLFPGDFSAPPTNPLALDPFYARFFSDLGIRTYDVGCHALRSHLHFSEITIDRVGHLNEKGHALVAALLEDYAKNLWRFPECLISGG